MSSYSVCWCFRRKFRPGDDGPPEEIKEVFEKYSEKGLMGIEQFQRFLLEVQGEEESGGGAQMIIDKYHSHFHRKKGLDLHAFFLYLFSGDNTPLYPLQVHHDMKQPLSHYYIYTGHNSYLVGNQLSSASSDVPIIKALKKGVRVIELDLWPSSSKDRVNVVHGRTLTDPVDLLQCLKSIKEHAFATSPYPVILTLEDHLTPDLQAKVAKMMTQTFGEMLYYPETNCLSEFPSPEELKNKIIISTKSPKEYLQLKNSMDKKNGSTQKVKSSSKETKPKETFDKKLPQNNDGHKYNEKNEVDEDINESDLALYQNAAKEYKCLIAIYVSKRVGQLKDWFKIEPNKVTRLSISEQAMEKAAESHKEDLIRFTQKNLLRIFPKASRIDSSNYDPLVGWMHGAQMVAFNMQGHGKSLWLMEGFFRANGGCGYLKKPDFLLKSDPRYGTFDPNERLPVKKRLKVKIYMGHGWRQDFRATHFDKYSPPDFYVKVGIVGVPADKIIKKTRIIEDDWIPVWNEEFTFPLTVPELALLHIVVREYNISEKDDFGGQTCFPITELKKGIRAVPLLDSKGQMYKSVKLLMHFQFE